MINSFFRVQKKHLVISFFVFFACVLISIILANDNSRPEGYELLFLLPLSFGILNIIFSCLYQYTANLAVIMILGAQAFRMVLIPLLMYFGDYYSAFYNTISYNISSAVGLMIYEMIIVFLVMIIACRKTNDYCNRIPRTRHKIDSLSLLLSLMVLFLLISYILFPNSTTCFKTIFDIKKDDFTTWAGLTASKYQIGSLDRIIATLFSMIFTWVRYLLPTAIIIWCKKHITQKVLGIILSSLTIFAQMFFITATIMESIICAFILFMALGKAYEKYRKQLFGIAIFCFLAIVIGYFVSRFIVRLGSGGNVWSFISENSNAYVGGVANVAAMINVPKENKWSTFFFNIYGAIPFNSTLFGLSGEKLAVVFNAANGRNDGQIPPTIGACWYYFSAILAPLESAIYTRIAVKFGRKSKEENNIWRYVVYTLITIMMVMGFTAYNSAIVLNYVTTLLIPLLILVSFTNDKKFEFNSL